MISAIVLTPDGRLGDNAAHAREIVARSLVWLVSAVIAGTVREVILAAPARLDLAGLADQSGCAFIEAEGEAARLAGAAAASRQARLLVIKAGHHPDAGFIDEIAAIERREPDAVFAALRAAPTTPLQRLLPRRAPIVGVLCPTAAARRASGFGALVRKAGRGLALQAVARPIV